MLPMDEDDRDFIRSLGGASSSSGGGHNEDHNHHQHDDDDHYRLTLSYSYRQQPLVYALTQVGSDKQVDVDLY